MLAYQRVFVPVTWGYPISGIPDVDRKVEYAKKSEKKHVHPFW
jgi:hypothetical protein